MILFSSYRIELAAGEENLKVALDCGLLPD